ncbi:translation initiation factor IF-2-like [Prionailurus bengalensis]|uniref:translation initiation factor IF-2-like n=1 Tax=Prionailurus bengalensis TaxID=37029 RepID=UPI001CA842C9|nr:translation initiation factor IF-2-like [Prionailurus bengalensis]
MEWGRGRPRWPQPQVGHSPPEPLSCLVQHGGDMFLLPFVPTAAPVPMPVPAPPLPGGSPPPTPSPVTLSLALPRPALCRGCPAPLRPHPGPDTLVALTSLLPKDPGVCFPSLPVRPSPVAPTTSPPCPALSHVPTLEPTLFKRVSFLSTSSPPTPCCPPRPRTQHPHGQVSQPVVFSAPPPPPRPRGASSAPSRAALACPLPHPHPAGHPRSWRGPDVLLAEALNGAVMVDVHGLRGRQRETSLLMCCWLCAHPALGCGKPPPASSGDGRTEGGAGTGVPSCGGALQLKTALPQLPQANPGRTGTRRS